MLYSARLSFFILLLLITCGNAYGLTAGFTADHTSGCVGLTVNFTNTSSGATSYKWLFGNGDSSTLASPSTTYTAVGTYTVKLTTSDGTSTATATATITIYGDPTVNFKVDDSAVCLGNTINFTDLSTPNSPGSATYKWNFGDGSSNTAENPPYTYGSTGTYSVTLAVTNSAGCKAGLTKTGYITVYGKPSANFSATPTTLCDTPATFDFVNSSTGSPIPLSYHWTFGDGTTDSSVSPSHTYHKLGSYTIRLITTSNAGCSDTLTQTNYVTVTKIYPSFTAITSACVGDYILFTNTSSPAATDTKWDFGDGTPVQEGSPFSHSFTAAKTYTVKMYTYNGSCVDSTVQFITIHPAPTVSFTHLPAQPCPAPSTISFTNTSSGATKYQWDFGDGISDTSASPSHTYYSNNSFQVRLIATSSFGCVDSSVSTTITIYPFKVDIVGNNHYSATGGCDSLMVYFSAVPYYDTPLAVAPTKYPYSISTYSWDFGDGSPKSSAATPSHRYTSLGSFTVRLTITSANGCTASDSFTVLTGPKPKADFTATPDSVCAGQTVYFTNLSSSAKKYQWFFGDGNSSLSDTPKYIYALPGLDTVMLVADNNGCKDTFIRNGYIRVWPPVAVFASTFGCTPFGKINFGMKVPPVNVKEINSFIWNFGDGATDTSDISLSHTYSSVGTYHVSLITYNDTTKCHDTATSDVTIVNPVASITASDTITCRNTKITFTSSLTGGGPTGYTWVFDTTATFPDTTASIVYKFANPGYHTVSVYIADSRPCADTATRVHYITIAQPKAAFSANPLLACVPLNVTFSDSSTDVRPAVITSYMWSYGDSSAWLPGSSVSYHAYTHGGNYTVMLAVKDNIGCTDTIIKPNYVSVHQPVASFAASPLVACFGHPITFNNTSSTPPFVSTNWSFGDGGTSATSSPVYTYKASGTYSVTLVIKDALGCSDSLTKTSYVTVVDNPKASFTMSDSFTICPVLAVDFTNNSTSGTTSYWDFGDGNSSLVTDPENIYVSPGIYKVVLIATNKYGCSDTAYNSVKLAGYSGAIKYSPLTGCAPLTVYFNALLKGVPHFVYDFSDGTTITSSSDTASHIYLKPGPYVPRLIMSDDSGCRAVSFGLDTIKVDGVLSGFSYLPNPACDSGYFTLIDTSHGSFSTVTSRLWVLPDGSTNTSNVVHLNLNHAGAYPITLITNTSSGCKDTLVTAMVVHPSPAINAGMDTTICVGDAAILNPSGGIEYIWSPKATLSCDSCTNPQAFPSVATTYSVIGIDTNGCKGTDTVTVSVKTKTTGTVSDSAQICQGDAVVIKDSAGYNAVYTWSPPSGLGNPNSDSTVASPSATTTYMVIARQGSCAADTQYVTVTVHPLPQINLGPSQTIIAGNSVQLNTNGNYISRAQWKADTTLSCDTCIDPVATPHKTTTYSVTAYSDYGCYDSANIKIIVVCDQSQVFMPNTFTPNGDGVDDIYYPRGKGLQIIKSFKIYDRWGQLVYSAEDIALNDKSKGWDGTFKGAKLTPDVFVYTVDAICVTGEPISWKGNISLIR